MNSSEAMAFLLGLADYERSPSEALAPTRYNLERVRKLLEVLGNPQARLRCIHIAGTKGKGSTAAMIAAVLTNSGHHTGFFSSPHLHDFRERIRLDGRLIGEADLATMAAVLKPSVEYVEAKHPDLGRLTTFEATTALALTYFAEKQAELAVLEAGLGGRLDATNVVVPMVSVLTSISLDHTQVLGASLADIAREKAGIIKHGGVVVSAPQQPEAIQVIQQVAEQRQARLLLVGRDCRWSERNCDEPGVKVVDVDGAFGRYDDVRVPLLGTHQATNAATAIAALDALRLHGIVVSPEQVRDGISKVKWPGRMEVVGTDPLLLVDGAHNADSMAKLCAALQDSFRYENLIVILGTSLDKDVAGMVGQLATIADHIIVTKSKHPRSAPVEEIANVVRSHFENVSIADDITTALDVARHRAGPSDLICATGSLFVVAEVREAVGAAVER